MRTETDTRLQPLYFLGDLSAKAQIKISLKDNNKDTPDTLSSWKDYFVRDTKWLEQELSDYGDFIFDQHVSECHFDGKYIDTELYADKNLKNVTPIEQYTFHDEKNQLEGFDYICDKKFDTVEVPLEVSIEKTFYRYGYQLSVYRYILDTSKVHRNTEQLQQMMLHTQNYEKDNIQMAIHQLAENDHMYFTDIKFRMVSAMTNNESYPWVVDYDQWYTISAADVLSTYKVQFNVQTLDNTQTFDHQSDPQYYIRSKVPMYYSEYSSDPTPPEPIDDDYMLMESLSTSIVSAYHGNEYHNVARGYNLWKSGYLEQFGFATCLSNQNTVVELPIPYDYENSNDSFYDFHTSMGDYTYNPEGNLLKDNRYTVQLTPIYNGHVQEGDVIEINTIRNDSFSIYN